MRQNVPVQRRDNVPRTHEGAVANPQTSFEQLERSVCACLLWEDTFYESGESIADRIQALVSLCDPDQVAGLAAKARTQMKLRHAPLLLCAALARRGHLKAEALAEVIQRCDELAEFVTLFWKDGKRALPNQVKKGLRMAFEKFDAYHFAKYDRGGAGVVRPRDVMFLCHPKPHGEERTLLYKQIAEQTLPTPDTWEVALSTKGNTKEQWQRFLDEEKLGGLALLRNLRNMREVGVEREVIKVALAKANLKRVLPFRFITAALTNPQFEDILEWAMFRCLEERKDPKGGDFPMELPGTTAICIDCSGSMSAKLSDKSILTCRDAACGIAMIARELCDEVFIVAFGTTAEAVPPRRGFALRDAIQAKVVGYGTDVARAVALANQSNPDRVFVISDMQSATSPTGPFKAGYMINVASYEHGINYGAWTEITGFSEAVLDYARQMEG